MSAGSAMVRLRAEIVRLSHEIDGFADMRSIRTVRAMAPRLAERLRQIAMRQEYVVVGTPPPPPEEPAGERGRDA